MALTGIDPFDPTPATRRELIFGAGVSSTGPDRQVLIYGNRTAAGSETVDVLSDTPISNEADAIARFGARSELYNMYRKYTEIDSGATIFGVAVTESVGSAGVCTLTFATTSLTATTCEIIVTGFKVSVPVSANDTPTVVAAAAADAINQGDDGKLQVVAVPALGVVTITAVHAGPRGDYIIGDAPATFGIRASFTTTTVMTVTKGGVVAGATEDTAASAIASASNREIYYQVVPWSTTNGTGVGAGSTYAVSSIDGQIGELMAMIRT